jgi:hypothetical protein
MDSNKWYRLFAFWDPTKPIETLIVCTHGLIKKTPKNEIEKAEQIRKDYFNRKL